MALGIKVCLPLIRNKKLYVSSSASSSREDYVIGNLLSPVPQGSKFDVSQLLIALDSSTFKLGHSFVIRFFASLITKPFVILTGLSGSGKTMLARVVALWFESEGSSESIIETSVKYTASAIDTSYGWTLNRDITQALVSSDDLEIKAELGGVPIDKGKLRYINQFYYSQDPKKDEISAKIREKFSVGDTIPVKLYIQNKNQKSFQNRYRMIAVGSDWTNREPLLGYPNALEKGRYVKPDCGALDLIIEASKSENSTKPYFLILDEMNLSHVERYFADFLSSMESGEPIYLHPDAPEWRDEQGDWKDGVPDKIALPKNLFVIGTVNIDETTYMFSPKVLDRAGVLEFRITEDEMKVFLAGPSKPVFDAIKGVGAGMATDFVSKALKLDYEKSEHETQVADQLNLFFVELKKVGAEFGYRSASEIFRFSSVLKNISSGVTLDEIIDAAIVQKLLPKLHGSRRKLEPVLEILASFCLHDRTVIKTIISEPRRSDYSSDPRVRFPLALEKILRMYYRAIHDGFTSFAEA